MVEAKCSYNGLPDALVVESLDICSFPEEAVQQICHSTGIPFDPKMLTWDNSENVDQVFSKWSEFHDAVLNSKGSKGSGTKK